LSPQSWSHLHLLLCSSTQGQEHVSRHHNPVFCHTSHSSIREGNKRRRKERRKRIKEKEKNHHNHNHIITITEIGNQRQHLSGSLGSPSFGITVSLRAVSKKKERRKKNRSITRERQGRQERGGVMEGYPLSRGVGPRCPQRQRERGTRHSRQSCWKSRKPSSQSWRRTPRRPPVARRV